MSSDNDQTAPVQVRYVQAPARISSDLFLNVLMLGIIAFGILGALVASYLVRYLDQREYSELIYLGSFAGSCGPWTWYCLRRQWLRQMKSAPGRLTRHRRLKRLSRQDGLKRRNPKFTLQRALLSPFGTNGAIWRVFERFVPGNAFAVSFPADKSFPRPTAVGIPFEPVQIDEPNEQLKSLLVMTLESSGIDSAGELQPPKLSKAGKVAQRRKRKPKGGDYIGLFVLIAYFVFVAQLGRGFPYAMVVGALLGIGIRYGPMLADPRRWWLVPGGIVYREARSWRKNMKVGMVTPENSPLFVHYEEGYALVRVNTMTLRIGCPDWTGWCVLAAWISTAARPTKEEILAFFGPDAEWEGT